MSTVDLHSIQGGLITQLKEGENGQIQMKYQEAAPEVSKDGDTNPTPKQDTQVQSQANNLVAYANNDLGLDVEYDVEHWWSQTDALTEYPTIYDVKDFSRDPETSRLWAPDTDLHSHPPILNKEQQCRIYPECFNGIGNFKMNTILN